MSSSIQVSSKSFPRPGSTTTSGEPERIFRGLQQLGLEPEWSSDTPLDYALTMANVHIERKTVPDLLRSLKNGELNRQLSEASEVDRILYLLVELPVDLDGLGKIVVNKVGRFPWLYVANYLLDIQEAGVRIVISPFQGATALTLSGIVRYWKNGDRGKRLELMPRELTFGGDYHPGLNLLLGLSGYSAGRAKAALRHFGTARKFFQATEKERLVVPGIGLGLAAEVDKSLDAVYNK